MERRTDRPRPFSQFRGHYRHANTMGPPFNLIQLAGQRLEQVPTRGRDAPAQHHQLRVQNVVQRRNGASQDSNRPQPNPACLPVTGGMRRHQFPGAGKPPAAPLPNRMFPDQILETPRSPGHIQRTVGIQAEMTEMTGTPDVTPENPAIRVYRPAHTRPQGQEINLAPAPSRTRGYLSHQRRVRVVEHRHHPLASEMRSPIEPDNPTHPPRHAGYRPPITRRQSRRTQANRGEPAKLEFQCVDHPTHGSRPYGHPVLEFAITGSLSPPAQYPPRIGLEADRLDLCPAQIDAT